MGDSRLETAIGVGAGIAISLAITIVAFAHWELIRMISERYKRIRYEQGLEEGRKEGLQEGTKLGRVLGKEEAWARFEEFLRQSGIELTMEDKAKLFADDSEQNTR